MNSTTLVAHTRRTLFAGTLFLLAAARSTDAALVNPGFETGDLTGWTTFATANGTLGTPAVVSFDTTGSGASLAAQLHVGQVSFVPGSQQGGGLMQAFATGNGLLTVTADIASQGGSSNNSEGGIFSLLVDGLAVDTVSFGAIIANEIKRDSLSYSGVVTTGAHSVGFLVTRPFTTVSTPFQYIDNVVVNVSGVPEPTTALFELALVGATGLARRRKAPATA